MKLVDTHISETHIHMRYANEATAAWIDFQVPLTDLRNPHNETHPLGDPEFQFLAECRQAALRYVRGTVADEIQRLAKLADRSRR